MSLFRRNNHIPELTPPPVEPPIIVKRKPPTIVPNVGYADLTNRVQQASQLAANDHLAKLQDEVRADMREAVAGVIAKHEGELEMIEAAAGIAETVLTEDQLLIDCQMARAQDIGGRTYIKELVRILGPEIKAYLASEHDEK